jgi:hypothetical protein
LATRLIRVRRGRCSIDKLTRRIAQLQQLWAADHALAPLDGRTGADPTGPRDSSWDKPGWDPVGHRYHLFGMALWGFTQRRYF